MTRIPAPRSDRQKLQRTHRAVESLARRPAPPSLGGTAVYAIEVVENYDPVLVNDDQFNWQIPEDLDGAVLLKCEAYVNTASSSGSVQIMVTKVPDSGIPADMLSDKIVVAANELNSFEPPGHVGVVDPSEEGVVWGDHLRIDVDAAGSGTLGLGVILYFTPLETKQMAVQGAQGDPGGVNNWTGQWSGAGSYSTADAVTSGGSSYVARVDNPTTEPGVDPGWEDEWMLLAQAQAVSAIEVLMNGNGYVLEPGMKAHVHVPFACTIVEATLLAAQAGSAVVDIWKDTYGSFPPANADSITASSPPTLSGAFKTTDVALTGWTTSIAAGDVLAINIDSCSFISILTLALKVERV